MAETINGLYKTEVIKRRGPWRNPEQVEFATAEWVDWYNHRRLYEHCGDMPPTDLETAYYDQPARQHITVSRQAGAIQTAYFRLGVSARAFHYLRMVVWRQVFGWLRRKHLNTGWKELRRRYCDGKWWPREGEIVLFNPGSVVTTRYRPRGTTIPSPWPARPEESNIPSAGMTRLHAMIAEQVGEAADEDVEVMVGIETGRGPWVLALMAAGYTVLAVNPLQAARYRQRLVVSGAKSDAADTHMLADMVRTDSHQLRPVAGDSPQAEAIKVVTRMHQTLIWERTRHAQRLRHALRDYFPAAVQAFEDLTAPDALALLAKAPDPDSAAQLTLAQITAVLKRAGRYKVFEKAPAIRAALRTEHLGQPAAVTTAYAASIRALTAVLVTVNKQITTLQKEVEAHFG